MDNKELRRIMVISLSALMIFMKISWLITFGFAYLFYPSGEVI